MTRSALTIPKRTRTALAVTAATLTVAPAALAQQPATGGTTASTSASTATPALPSAISDPAVLVTTGPVSLRMRPATLLGQTLNFHGSTSAASAGANVLIQRYDARRGAWVPATSTIVNRRGHFLAAWRTNLAGHIAIRALVLRARPASLHRSGSLTPQSSQQAQVTVYRPALATYFGPGFYGHKTACGEVMSTSLVGVASRTLPCGELVEVDYGGHRLTVPVVDRGPYANGADWDLTSAAATVLGMTESERIGTIIVGHQSVPAPPNAPSSPAASPSDSGGGTPAG